MTSEQLVAAMDRSITVRDRWNGDVLDTFHADGAAEASEAVTAAVRAMEAGLGIPARSAVLSKVADHVAERSEEFAVAIQAETGKPISAARVEVGRAVGTLRYAAEEARRLPAEAVPLDATEAGAGTLALTVAEPRGVVAAITPFNFPINLVVHKVGPALAAGCAVVFKPSDKAVVVAGMLVEAFEKCGLPDGWLNLVSGPAEPIVGAWVEDDRVAVITFTGSSSIGWKIKAASPRKIHILELGSNTAMYVHNDADLERAVADAVTAGYGNSGQACVSLQRLYVHQEVAERFTELLGAAVASIPSGDPTDPQTVVGPLITPLAGTRVLGWIDDAVARGARIVQGGTSDHEVVAPTLITAVPDDSPLIREEVFGPVVSLVPVEGLEDALRRVNASDFGLNAAVHTSNLAVAMEFGRRAEAGSVLVNMPPSFRADHMPYGGVKHSGQGREGVKYAVEELVHRKLIVFKP